LLASSASCTVVGVLIFGGIEANQNRVGHHFVAIGQLGAALFADLLNRANQVLVLARVPGHDFHHNLHILQKYCIIYH
jgi:hypothetical protein